VRLHATELREVLCSLIILARDAMPEGGRLEVRTFREDGRAEVILSHGGAPHDEAGRALALEAARDAARRAGGELSADTFGGEVVYRLALPIAAESAVAEPPPAAAPAVRRRVLVVDDDAGNLETLSELLTLLGHDVDATPTSQEALQAARGKRYDAALVDLAMPEMNGRELARRLRAELPSLRVALVTGWETSQPEAPEIAEAVFHKPIDLPAIQRFLEAAPPG
jgi:CheY-like chemotaxis protein